ncbi:hypothetical protein ACVWXO_006214 [Bradyrhizobium sp. LM2.7]
MRAGLGSKASQIVAEGSYELADPTIDSQIIQLKAEETLIRQATSLHGERMPLMLPGVSISTELGDYTAFKVSADNRAEGQPHLSISPRRGRAPAQF